MGKIKLFTLVFLMTFISLWAQEKKYETYRVKAGENIQSIAKSLAITPYDIMKLNPDVKGDVQADDLLIIPNKNYDPLNDIKNADLSSISDKDIVVGQFVYHEVVPKETLYSLLKKFNISLEELNSNNPFVAEEGLKIGQVVKIPLKIDESVVERENKNTQPYLVKPKETKYSISREFGITIEYLEELNPKIVENGLQIDDVILVPAESATLSNGNFLTHKVLPKETMYSLSKKYGLSETELTDLNPELSAGLKIGMLIKIPKKEADFERKFSDQIPEGKQLKIAMMLPFKTEQDTLDFENNKLLNITTEFYQGALIALDSLRGQGLSIYMKVFDTDNSKQRVNQISRNKELLDYQAIIGPMFLSNVKTASNNLKYGSPLIISPISTKDHSVIDNRKLVQERASLENHTLTMLDYIKENYDQQELIVIKNESKKSQEQFDRIIDDIRALNPNKEVTILETKEGYIKPEEFKVFRDTLDRNIVNWFFLTDNDPAYLGDVFNNLGVFPEADSLMVFGFEKDRNFNKIDNDFLARVNYHYPTNYHLDISSDNYLRFEKVYRKRFADIPSRYAVEGFDLTYDILMRLANDSNLVEQGSSKRLATRYRFIENTSGSLINQGIYIIRYDGLQLKVMH